MSRSAFVAVMTVLALVGCGESRPARPPVVPAAASSPSSPTFPSTSAASATPRIVRSPTRHARSSPRPAIAASFIPFGPRRKAEMVSYARRHYGSFMAPTYRLMRPLVIVEHFTETATFSAAYNTFASDAPDSELHETPGTCAHFVIDRDGTIYQLVPTSVMCRHTVGLNWTAIGIEHVGFSDQQVLSDPRQMHSSLALTCWLRQRYRIARRRNVIGHNESLSSPFHREDTARLRTQTHSDFSRPDMNVYRQRLKQSCPGV